MPIGGEISKNGNGTGEPMQRKVAGRMTKSLVTRRPRQSKIRRHDV
jgi:hypothetical protein